MMRANFHLKLLFPEVIQSHCISDLFFFLVYRIKVFCESEDHGSGFSMFRPKVSFYKNFHHKNVTTTKSDVFYLIEII